MDIMEIPSKWNRIFRKEVIRLLLKKNIIDKGFSDLENLHNHIDMKFFDYLVREKENELQHIFYETDDKFISIYHEFLNELKNYLKFDFYFQSTPTMRFHAPKLKNENRFPEFHSDMGYGHPPQEINIWFSLTKNKHSNFYVIDKEKSNKWVDDYDSDYKKFTEVSYNSKDKSFNEKGFSLAKEVESTIDDIFLFDSSCIHAGTPRIEETRVSIDIRINTVDEFVDGYMGFGVVKPQFRPGGRFGYDKKSIGELYENNRI
jgi:ectoine hydroxylase-related dioxygenase (phytanoyl-CoA dioxygenase family)